MRRQLRCAFNFSAAVSAVLFVGVCVLWARRPANVDSLSLRRGHHVFCADSHRGGVSFVAAWSKWDDPDASHWRPQYSHDFPVAVYDDAPYLWHAGGIGRQRMVFVMERGSTGPILVLDAWTAPHWAACAVLVLAQAGLAVCRLTQRRQQRLGLCQKCGYDLRATPGRWPECGHIPAGKAVT